MSDGSPAPDAAHRRRVLLVDDDALAQHRTARALSRNGYEVVTAASVATALERLVSGSYDAVIAETCMSDGTGFDVFHAAREVHADLPVVFVGSDRSLPSRIGAIRYIYRSHDSSALLAVVVELCGVSHSPHHPVEPHCAAAVAS